MNIESLKRYRTFLIVYVYIIVAIYGTRAALPIDMGLRGYLFGLVISFAVAYICIIDSHITRKSLPMPIFWFILAFFPASVLFYFTIAHGLKGLMFCAFHFIGIILIFSASFNITYYLVYSSLPA